MSKKHKIIYPAIFSPERENYNVTLPDTPEAIPFGEESIDEAVEMAQSALGLAIYDQESHPKETNPDSTFENEDDFILMVTLDLAEYRRKNHAKTIRNNTSIPE